MYVFKVVKKSDEVAVLDHNWIMLSFSDTLVYDKEQYYLETFLINTINN